MGQWSLNKRKDWGVTDMAGGMIIDLLNKADNITQQFVMDGYQHLASTYSPEVHSLAALCVIVYGYAAIQGWVSLSLAETLKRLLLIGFVIEFALNAGTFTKYVYDFFTAAPNEIATEVINSIPSAIHSTDGVNGALEQTWYDGIKCVFAMFDHGGLNHPLPYLWGVFVFILVLLQVGIALVELILAKFGLAIFLVLSPLVIPTLLFKATKEMLFDGWLKHLITFAFIPVFITAALALGLVLLSSAAGSVKAAVDNDTMTITVIVPYLIGSFVCIGLLIKAAHMASSLASGFSMGMTPYLASKASDFRRWVTKPRPNKPKNENSSTNKGAGKNP